MDSHIQALRRKLGPELVRTVHGVGYAIDTGPPASAIDTVAPGPAS